MNIISAGPYASRAASAIGYIDDIEDGVARVLIGPDEDEWFFPLGMLPDDVQPGDDMLFVEAEGRFAVAGFARVATHSADRAIEDRLHRPLAARRAGRFGRTVDR